MTIVTGEMGENTIVKLIQDGADYARKGVKVLGIEPTTLTLQFGHAIVGNGLEDGDDGMEIGFTDADDSESPIDNLNL